MLGDVPDLGERFIFQGLLRLRLAVGPSSDSVAGFAVAARSDEWILLRARSTLLTCHLLIQAQPEQVSLATVMRYHRRLGAMAWTPVSAVHRRLAAGLLRDAAAKLART